MTTHESSKQEQSSSINPWYFILAVLVVAIFVFGYVGYTKYQENLEQESYTYNGFEFALAQNGDDSLWVTQISVQGQLYNIPFYFHPSATEEVLFSEGLAEGIVDNPNRPEKVYFTLSPDAGSRPVIAAVELSRLFGTKYNLLNMEVQSALTEPVEGMDLATITCENATPGVLVIDFTLGSDNAVLHEGNCVHVIYTSPEESIRVADRFAYEILKIM